MFSSDRLRIVVSLGYLSIVSQHSKMTWLVVRYKIVVSSERTSV